MALLTVQYTAPLPAGFVSGTVELKNQTVYVDGSGRTNQPYRKYTLNADKSLTSLQGDATPQIVGMAAGDPATAGPLDVVVTMTVNGLPTPLRSTFTVPALDTGGATLNLHAPNLTSPVVGPFSPAVIALIGSPTDRKFVSANASNPISPTAGDLTAFPGNIYGSRFLATGAAQLTLWNRSTSAWGDFGQPSATKADTDAAAATANSANATASTANSNANAANSKATSLLNAISNTKAGLTSKGQADGPQFTDGYRWLWQSTGPANGGTIVAGLTGFWRAERVLRINVQDFGAKGDGSDDTAAIQAAVSFCRATLTNTQVLATLYFPLGYYRYTSTLVFDFRINVVGEYGFGSAVTLLYDPPSGVVASASAYGFAPTGASSIDPASIPAMLFTGTRTGGTTSVNLGNGQLNGGTANLLYGCQLSGLQLATQAANAGKLDGLVLRDVSELDYERINVNGQFRNGVTYWGASLINARRVNIANCTRQTVTRNGNATNWTLAAVAAYHHHFNSFQCGTGYSLSGATRNFVVSDSWQEYMGTHIQVLANANEALDIDNVVFSNVQFSNGSATQNPDSRLLVIDTTATLAADVVRVKGLAINNAWAFLAESSKAFVLAVGAATDSQIEPLNVKGLELFGMADTGVAFSSASAWKVDVNGGFVFRKHWFSPYTQNTNFNSSLVTLLNFGQSLGALRVQTTPDGTRSVTGKALAVFQNGALLKASVTYPSVASADGTAPSVTVTAQGTGTYAGSSATSYTVPVVVRSANVTNTGCDLVVYWPTATPGFVTGDQVTLAFRVDGVTA